MTKSGCADNFVEEVSSDKCDPLAKQSVYIAHGNKHIDPSTLTLLHYSESEIVHSPAASKLVRVTGTHMSTWLFPMT